MQMMYILTFLVALFAMVFSQTRGEVESAEDGARAIASHMASWHRAAHDYCVSSAPCPRIPAANNIRGMLQDSVRSAPAFSTDQGNSAGRFGVRYDASQRVLVTFLSSTSLGQGSSAEIHASLIDLLSDSRNVGVWNSASRRITLGNGEVIPLSAAASAGMPATTDPNAPPIPVIVSRL